MNVYDGHMDTDTIPNDESFSAWLRAKFGPTVLVLDTEHDECDCSECENERALDEDADR